MGTESPRLTSLPKPAKVYLPKRGNIKTNLCFKLGSNLELPIICLTSSIVIGGMYFRKILCVLLLKLHYFTNKFSSGLGGCGRGVSCVCWSSGNIFKVIF